MRAVIVCKGCGASFRIPLGDWPACPTCGGDEYRMSHDDGSEPVQPFDQRITPADIGDGPDREPWEDREDRLERRR